MYNRIVCSQANIRGKITHSIQTNLSHHKRDQYTQYWQLKSVVDYSTYSSRYVVYNHYLPANSFMHYRRCYTYSTSCYFWILPIILYVLYFRSKVNFLQLYIDLISLLYYYIYPVLIPLILITFFTLSLIFINFHYTDPSFLYSTAHSLLLLNRFKLNILVYRDSDTQTKRDVYTNIQKPSVFIAGLRGCGLGQPTVSAKIDLTVNETQT